MNYFIRPIMINSKFKDCYSTLLSVFFPLLSNLLKILSELMINSYSRIYINLFFLCFYLIVRTCLPFIKVLLLSLLCKALEYEIFLLIL